MSEKKTKIKIELEVDQTEVEKFPSSMKELIDILEENIDEWRAGFDHRFWVYKITVPDECKVIEKVWDDEKQEYKVNRSVCKEKKELK